MPQPLRELRVKNAYLTPSKVYAAQGVKITAKGDLDKTVAGTPLFVAHQQDEVEVLKVSRLSDHTHHWCNHTHY